MYDPEIRKIYNSILDDNIIRLNFLSELDNTIILTAYATRIPEICLKYTNITPDTRFTPHYALDFLNLETKMWERVMVKNIVGADLDYNF